MVAAPFPPPPRPRAVPLPSARKIALASLVVRIHRHLSQSAPTPAAPAAHVTLSSSLSPHEHNACLTFRHRARVHRLARLSRIIRYSSDHYSLHCDVTDRVWAPPAAMTGGTAGGHSDGRASDGAGGAGAGVADDAAQPKLFAGPRVAFVAGDEHTGPPQFRVVDRRGRAIEAGLHMVNDVRADHTPAVQVSVRARLLDDHGADAAHVSPGSPGAGNGSHHGKAPSDTGASLPLVAPSVRKAVLQVLLASYMQNTRKRQFNEHMPENAKKAMKKAWSATQKLRAAQDALTDALWAQFDDPTVDTRPAFQEHAAAVLKQRTRFATAEMFFEGPAQRHARNMIMALQALAGFCPRSEFPDVALHLNISHGNEIQHAFDQTVLALRVAAQQFASVELRLHSNFQGATHTAKLKQGFVSAGIGEDSINIGSNAATGNDWVSGFTLSYEYVIAHVHGGCLH